MFFKFLPSNKKTLEYFLATDYREGRGGNYMSKIKKVCNQFLGYLRILYILPARRKPQ